MKKVFTALAALAVLALMAGCAPTMSLTKAGEQITDFKAAADSNVEIVKAVSDVQWAQQEAVTQCFKNAKTDAVIGYCAMLGQSANLSQNTTGRPVMNRVPDSGNESNEKVAGKTIDGAKSLGTAAVVGASVNAVSKSVSGVQAKDPIVQVVRPEVVMQPEPIIITP